MPHCWESWILLLVCFTTNGSLPCHYCLSVFVWRAAVSERLSRRLMLQQCTPLSYSPATLQKSSNCQHTINNTATAPWLLLFWCIIGVPRASDDDTTLYCWHWPPPRPFVIVSPYFLSRICSFLRILGTQHECVVLTLYADKQPALFEKCKRGRDVKSGGEMFQPRGKTRRETQWDGKRGERRLMRRSQLKMECFIFSQGWKQETENRAENLKDAESERRMERDLWRRKRRRGENIEQFHAQNAGVKAGGREQMRGRSGDFRRGHSVQAGGKWRLKLQRNSRMDKKLLNDVG